MCSHTLVSRTLIPFVASLVEKDVGIDRMLNDAADQHGKTVTEAELEQQFLAELHATEQRRARLVESVSEGIVEPEEAREPLKKLRAKIGRLQGELDNIGQKAKIREDYLKGVELLRGLDIEQVLWQIAEEEPATLRQILGLIFEPTSIVVRTYRIPGSNKFCCDILDYQFTEAFGELQSVQDEITNSYRPRTHEDC